MLQRALNTLHGWKKQHVSAYIFVRLLQAVFLCSLGCVKCVVFIFVYGGEYLLKEVTLLVFFHLKTS